MSLCAAAGAISRPSIAVNLPSALRIRIRHPPPMPEFSPSTTPSVSAAVTAASTALPPSRNTSTAASVASGCPVATIARSAVAVSANAGEILRITNTLPEQPET